MVQSLPVYLPRRCRTRDSKTATLIRQHSAQQGQQIRREFQRFGGRRQRGAERGLVPG